MDGQPASQPPWCVDTPCQTSSQLPGSLLAPWAAAAAEAEAKKSSQLGKGKRRTSSCKQHKLWTLSTSITEKETHQAVHMKQKHVESIPAVPACQFLGHVLGAVRGIHPWYRARADPCLRAHLKKCLGCKRVLYSVRQHGA